MFQKINGMLLKARFAAEAKFNSFIRKEDGDVNIVSIVVLIGIAVVLALVFRKQIKGILDKLFTAIGKNADNALTTYA